MSTISGVALLEAQAANGFIVDGLTGETMSVDDAIDQNLIIERRQEIVKRASKAIFGFEYKDLEGNRFP